MFSQTGDGGGRVAALVPGRGPSGPAHFIPLTAKLNSISVLGSGSRPSRTTVPSPRNPVSFICIFLLPSLSLSSFFHICNTLVLLIISFFLSYVFSVCLPSFSSTLLLSLLFLPPIFSLFFSSLSYSLNVSH